MCTAFVGGVPAAARLRGRAAGAGARRRRWTPSTRTATRSSGQVGELVLTQPMPSMPMFFWGDEDGSRLRESYFAMYPGIWRHGDWIRITDARHGDHLRPLGLDHQPRRDPHGHERDLPRGAGRATTSSTRSWSTCRAQGTDGWMPLFVVLREGAELDDELVARIKRRIREDCSPRHVPNEIHQIAEVPRTLSGKVLEVPVKRILMGQPAEQGREPRVAGQPRARWTTSSSSRGGRERRRARRRRRRRRPLTDAPDTTTRGGPAGALAGHRDAALDRGIPALARRSASLDNHGRPRIQWSL